MNVPIDSAFVLPRETAKAFRASGFVVPATGADVKAIPFGKYF